ncbi:alpha/beta fold hydrolase [Pseudonocardia acaciae]|uniref:alpha/beta fold hydrolase n=1 Tax=Pseudonocardia acaciae TaxID=551276 RepID=UPI0007E8BA91
MWSYADPAERVTPYHRAGVGSPLVLLHGATMSWRAWEPVLPFLVRRHDVFAPTLAGHRGGPPLRDGAPAGLDSVVDVLCDQLDEAGIETAHLVGNSLGGWLAFELARRGRARSVLGLSPAGTWRARRDVLRLLWMFRLGYLAVGNPVLTTVAENLTRNAVLRRAVLGRVVARPGRVSAERLRDMLADMAGCDLLPAMLAGREPAEPMAEFDVALCPVRIAWAQRDRVIPFRRYGRPMREVVRGAEFGLLRGVGHVPMYDDPRLVARTILELTSAVDAGFADAEPDAEPDAGRLRSA